MKITFLGHASLLLDIDGISILVDPFITGNELAKNKVDIGKLKPEYILVTHAHQDHTLDVEEIARQSDATVVSNFEVANHFETKGIKVHPMNHGGQWEFRFGTVKYVNAIHTSSFSDGSYGGQPGGFIIVTENRQLYIAGDTALTMDMKLLPLKYKLDLAVLPIGDNFTMGVEDAVIASDFLQCSKVLGYHYDTFGYIKIDHEGAKKTFSSAGKTLHLLDIGESITI